MNLCLYEQISKLSVFPQLVSYYKSGQAPECKKRSLVKALAREGNFLYAVETGTYFGRTSRILKKYVQNVYTIEIKKELHEYVKHKLRNSKINFLLGNSEDLIQELVNSIQGRTLFYLDSHASGGVTGRGLKVTSLGRELEIIDKFKFLAESIILIDDAGSINGSNDYPEFEDIMNLVKSNGLKIYRTKMNSFLLVGPKFSGLPTKSKKYLSELMF